MQKYGFTVSFKVDTFLSFYGNHVLEIPSLAGGVFSERAKKYLRVKRQKTAAVLEHFSYWLVGAVLCALHLYMFRRQFVVKYQVT